MRLEDVRMAFTPSRFAPNRPVEARPVTLDDFEVRADYDGALELHCKHCGRWHAVGFDLAPMVAAVATHRCADTWQSVEYGA